MESTNGYRTCVCGKPPFAMEWPAPRRFSIQCLNEECPRANREADYDETVSTTKNAAVRRWTKLLDKHKD